MGSTLTSPGIWREQNPKFFAQDIDQQSSTQKAALGARWNFADGRSFVYCKAGASALAAGKLMQSPAPAANHLNKLVKLAAAIGAKQVKLAIGATAITSNMYKEGYFHVNDATGEGYNYKVKDHAAYSASSAAVYINLYDPIKIALVASTSEYTLTKHPSDGIILCPTTLTAPVIGVTPIAVSASYYFWAQVKGPAACLTGGVVVVGGGVAPSAGTGAVAGAVMPEAAGTITSRVGVCMRVNGDTEYSLINLNIPGY